MLDLIKDDSSTSPKSARSEEFCWVCRFCGAEGPWQKDNDKYPRGWAMNEDIGLRCTECKRKEG
jgi:hypothetical protein